MPRSAQLISACSAGQRQANHAKGSDEQTRDTFHEKQCGAEVRLDTKRQQNSSKTLSICQRLVFARLLFILVLSPPSVEKQETRRYDFT
jgi:hypothetical protein